MSVVVPYKLLREAAYLIRNSRGSVPVHEEQVHPLHVLPPPPPPLHHRLAVQCSVQPHLSRETWRNCRRRSVLAVGPFEVMKL